MAERKIPPLSGHAPPLKCGRLLSWPDESSACRQEATWHVIWNVECDNSVECDTHHAEVLAKWAHLASHVYRMECSMPGATFLYDENVCVVDEDLLGLTAVVALEDVNR